MSVAMHGPVEPEIEDSDELVKKYHPTIPESAVEICSASGNINQKRPRAVVDDNANQGRGGMAKTPKLESSQGQRQKQGQEEGAGVDGVELPLGFLDPLPPEQNLNVDRPSAVNSCKQFWKAGDYEGECSHNFSSVSTGMDHLRVHPKFLHSNATSHKWALGGFAELLDNSLDETCNGATYVSVDVLPNSKDGSRMLVVEDNGGGMTPDILRQCMSLGYSAKRKLTNTIGQYGNGFKTSTMRLGADVIVFSRCNRKGSSPTQSIGMLSYTFLRNTGKEDIVVPIIDYEKRGQSWNMLIKSSSDVWTRNLDTILQWSPYTSEENLLHQFSAMGDQGTRIVIYNLWEDDQGNLELDFESDPHDIQLRGVCRNEKKIDMAKKYPNSTHFLTYEHSLRSYASILYLRIPADFQIILRGKDISHHSIVNDMMYTVEHTYRPQSVIDKSKDPNVSAVVTLGFVKDAVDHIDVQGFNVYHKNRLIKPFWRVWNSAGSSGRGVIGVLEANFVEPAHDKQGFERTIVLSRLEARLIEYQKKYWSLNCDKIGYATRRVSNMDKESQNFSPVGVADKKKPCSQLNSNRDSPHNANSIGSSTGKCEKSSLPKEPFREPEKITAPHRTPIGCKHWKAAPSLNSSAENDHMPNERCQVLRHQGTEVEGVIDLPGTSDYEALSILKRENNELRERLKQEVQRCQKLQDRLLKSENKIKELDMEGETLISVFSEERERRDEEENNLRNRLKDASRTISQLITRLRQREKP